jgi:hypothetical protein
VAPTKERPRFAKILEIEIITPVAVFAITNDLPIVGHVFCAGVAYDD